MPIRFQFKGSSVFSAFTYHDVRTIEKGRFVGFLFISQEKLFDLGSLVYISSEFWNSEILYLSSIGISASSIDFPKVKVGCEAALSINPIFLQVTSE